MWGQMIQMHHWMIHHVTAKAAASQQLAATYEELFENETDQPEPFASSASAP